jgi:hypothetical protein
MVERDRLKVVARVRSLTFNEFASTVKPTVRAPN